MPWILIAILVLIVVLFGVFLFWKKNKVAEARQLRFLLGGAIGGIVGSVVGIALVEFAGYSYPLPAILFFLGMAAGQLIGLLYQKLRE
jgi:lipoprotein signal peptidase